MAKGECIFKKNIELKLIFHFTSTQMPECFIKNQRSKGKESSQTAF
jgi:hypothetical protein